MGMFNLSLMRFVFPILFALLAAAHSLATDAPAAPIVTVYYETCTFQGDTPGNRPHKDKIVRWEPGMTVIGALMTSAPVDSFARKLRLVRDGKVLLETTISALQKNPNADPPVMPGDWIIVP
jgi:hypothetical protein